MGSETFLVNAGDTPIISNADRHLRRLTEIHRALQAYATVIGHEIENPTQYGDAYRVNLAVEKPECPPTNFAIIPVYIFDPIVFEAVTEFEPRNLVYHGVLHHEG